MTPPDSPQGTSADAGGSIRDRLKSPAPSEAANSGGDSRESGVTDDAFQQTDSAAALAARGRSDQQESQAGGVATAAGHHPVALDPAWRTEAVVGLAAGVYADLAFERLPVLADALEDAGCANPDVLGHCRSAGPHARGCWVVDLILGKA